jgi:hypothetical protein
MTQSKEEGKIVPIRNWAQWFADIWRVAPRILNLGKIWMVEDNFTLRPLYFVEQPAVPAG